ncbi:unnamed protein product, partial [Symbiodinium sp. KB8]
MAGSSVVGGRSREDADYESDVGEDLMDDELMDEEEEEDEDMDALSTGLTENQGRMLYLIGLYTKPARTAADKEEWIRRQALLVLIYEAIVAQVLDFDYAPASEVIEGKRRYFNKSQEGCSDIDFLREEELLNGLKLSSKSYLPVTCYQISKKGQELVRRMPKHDKEAVHELIFAPGTRELLRVVWRGEQYVLLGPAGYERISSATEIEDVSYVSSAYVPQCLRFGGRPTISQADRAGECAVSVSNIRDELDEVITLNSVSIIEAEFIPCGANQIVQMNVNLGSTERVQGGFFTALIDEDETGTKFEVEPGLTSVDILDYTLTKHLNFEADIHLPEEAGIVQVETFGVSINADGTVFYGMQLEAVMDRIKDNISLDHLSRLLVDVARDSSTIVDSVISSYQRRLLNLVFTGDAEQRDKVNLIIANEITPHLTAEEYLDKGEYENELKQVIGDTRAAFDVSEHDTLIFGSTGLLIAGPNSRHHEPLLCSFLQFTAMDLFVRNFWNRLFLIKDAMKRVRSLLNTHYEDPESLHKIRADMQRLEDDIRMLGEILGYLKESLDSSEVPPEPADAAGRSLYERLQIADLAGQLSVRVTDLRKNVASITKELDFLNGLASIVAESRLLRTHDRVEQNTRSLVRMHETHNRVASLLEIVGLLLSGLIAFAILDRITGSWSVMDTQWMKDFADPMITGSPILWFFFNMLFWATCAYGLYRLLLFWDFQYNGTLTVRIKIMQRYRPDRFNLYLESKPTAMEERDAQNANTMVRISWEEPDVKAYGGAPPRVTVEYDADTEFIHFVDIVYNRREAKKELQLESIEVRNRVAGDMREAGVFDDPDYSFREDPRIIQDDDDMGGGFELDLVAGTGEPEIDLARLNAILVGLLVTVAILAPVAAKVTRSRYLVVDQPPVAVATRFLQSVRGNLSASVFRTSLTGLATTEAALAAADATSITALVLVTAQFALRATGGPRASADQRWLAPGVTACASGFPLPGPRCPPHRRPPELSGVTADVPASFAVARARWVVLGNLIVSLPRLLSRAGAWSSFLVPSFVSNRSLPAITSRPAPRECLARDAARAEHLLPVACQVAADTPRSEPEPISPPRLSTGLLPRLSADSDSPPSSASPTQSRPATPTHRAAQSLTKGVSGSCSFIGLSWFTEFLGSILVTLGCTELLTPFGLQASKQPFSSLLRRLAKVCLGIALPPANSLLVLRFLQLAVFLGFCFQVIGGVAFSGSLAGMLPVALFYWVALTAFIFVIVVFVTDRCIAWRGVANAGASLAPAESSSESQAEESVRSHSTMGEYAATAMHRPVGCTRCGGLSRKTNLATIFTTIAAIVIGSTAPSLAASLGQAIMHYDGCPTFLFNLHEPVPDMAWPTGCSSPECIGSLAATAQFAVRYAWMSTAVMVITCIVIILFAQADIVRQRTVDARK